MPRRKYAKRSYRRRFRRKRRYKRNFVGLGKAPMPKKFATKLKTVHTFSLDPGIGTAALQVLRCMSPYDPSYTDAGESVRGWTSLMEHYTHCTVIGAKIKVTVHKDAGDVPVVLGIDLRPTTTAASTIDDYIESGYCKKTVVGTSGEGLVRTLNYGFSPKKYFGVKNVLDNQNFRCQVTSNPGEDAYWHVWMASMDQSSNPTAATAMAEIEYICVFTEPKLLDGE